MAKRREDECPKCGTRMEEKWVLDGNLKIYQCPNCKNIELNYY